MEEKLLPNRLAYRTLTQEVMTRKVLELTNQTVVLQKILPSINSKNFIKYDFFCNFSIKISHFDN
jgi:hypothetical protein